MGKGTRAAGSRGRGGASTPPPSGYGAGSRQAPGGSSAAGDAQVGAGGGRRGAAASAPPPPSTPARSAERQESGRPKAGRGATFSVLMMTLVALAAVGVLAAQAEATAPKVRAQSSNASSAKTSTKSGSASTSSSTVALPANSGSGTRIVYSPSEQRVWLVQGSTVERSARVRPGTIPATAGDYTVSAKTPGATGGDNVQVLYVVRFSLGSGTVFGFDAEATYTGLPPAPTGQTTGIRMAQLDAQALYEFASVGTTVVVVN